MEFVIFIAVLHMKKPLLSLRCSRRCRASGCNTSAQHRHHISCVLEPKFFVRHGTFTTWTHWDLNPGPSACGADVIPLHHEPGARRPRALASHPRYAREASVKRRCGATRKPDTGNALVVTASMLSRRSE